MRIVTGPKCVPKFGMNKREQSAFPYTEQCYNIYYKDALVLLMFREIMLKTANGMTEVYSLGSAGVI